MKKSLLLILFTAVLFACKKDNQPESVALGVSIPADYRDSIVGNYAGTKRNYLYMMGFPLTQSDTTYPWIFTVVKDTSDSSVIADGGIFKLDTALACYEEQLPGPLIRSIIFRNDSAILYFRSGGLGGYGTTTISGKLQ